MRIQMQSKSSDIQHSNQKYLNQAELFIWLFENKIKFPNIKRTQF